MISAEVRGNDGPLGDLTDLLFELPSWIAPYGGIRRRNRSAGEDAALLPTELLEAAATGGASFATSAGRAVFARAPALPTEGELTRAEEVERRRVSDRALRGGDPAELPPAPGSALHGLKALMGGRLHAFDGDIGNVTDALVEVAPWHVRYLVVATHARPSPSHVVLATAWVASIDWGAVRVTAEVDRETVRTSPAYDPERPVHPEYAARLHLHYRKGAPGTSTPPPALL